MLKTAFTLRTGGFALVTIAVALLGSAPAKARVPSGGDHRPACPDTVGTARCD